VLGWCKSIFWFRKFVAIGIYSFSKDFVSVRRKLEFFDFSLPNDPAFTRGLFDFSRPLHGGNPRLLL